eukprot:scaffold1981_cov345-Pinguiococcus_pyrenoidosus.AAC.1
MEFLNMLFLSLDDVACLARDSLQQLVALLWRSKGLTHAAFFGLLGLVLLCGRLWWAANKKAGWAYRAGALLSGLRRVSKSEVCIGAIFGMDVGGSLSKVVYYEPLPQASPEPKERRSARRGRRKTLDSLDGPAGPVAMERSVTDTGRPEAAAAEPPVGKMRRSRSFDNLVSPDHMAVLREFYRIMDETRQLGLTGVREEDLKFHSEELGGILHFIRFETQRMEGAMDFVAAHSLHLNITHIPCTGGGAYKYASVAKQRLEIEFDKHDEMECLVRGLQFVLDNVKDEVYTYKPSPAEQAEAANETMRRKDKEFTLKQVLPSASLKRTFPFMVVSIGTGVSIIKVEGPGKFERVSGSSIGGGTYWGLCRLFTKATTFKQVLDLAEDGTSEHLDMSVGDIYGGDYTSIGLPAETVAGSFGKLASKERPWGNVRDCDFARSLLLMITNNIGQVAYLNAIQHDVRNIFFIGSFMRHNSISATRLAYAIDFWSKGTMEALFLKHEGFFGALGAFLTSSYRTGKERPARPSSPAPPRVRSTSYDGLNRKRPPMRFGSDVNPRRYYDSDDSKDTRNRASPSSEGQLGKKGRLHDLIRLEQETAVGSSI